MFLDNMEASAVKLGVLSKPIKYDLGVYMIGRPRWGNCLAWLKAIHETEQFWMPSKESAIEEKVLAAGFTIAAKMRSPPRTDVEAVLESVHVLAISDDSRWA